MKATVFIPLILALTSAPGHTQKTDVYKAWIHLTNGDRLYGALSAANEEGLTILDWKTHDTVAMIKKENIDIIKFRRKGSMGTGAWIGAVGGAIVGGIIGYSEGDDDPGWFAFTAEQKAVLTGTAMMGPGIIVGMVIGGIPKKFKIMGNTDTYMARLPQIQAYVLQ